MQKVVDIKDIIKKALARLVEQYPAYEPMDIVQPYMAHLNEVYPAGYSGMDQPQMIKFVKNLRTQMRGNDVWGTIEEYNMRMSKDEDGPIILFNVFITVDKVTHRFVGFSHRILLKKIRTRSHFFFDGTFKVVPNMFDQLLNGMI